MWFLCNKRPLNIGNEIVKFKYLITYLIENDETILIVNHSNIDFKDTMLLIVPPTLEFEEEFGQLEISF